MPADSGMAFVVVVHLAPDHVSHLPGILARWTRMPVESVTENQRLQGDRVYVLPAGASVAVAGGRLHLKPRVSPNRPIDDFLMSLAEDRGGLAVGIVLSGTGHDGTAGLAAIRARGGITLAQSGSPTAARHPEMPNHAIASGAVIHAVPVEEMPTILMGLDGAARGVSGKKVGKAELLALLLQRTGHDFSGYKEQSFLRRVQRRVVALKLGGLDAYADYLQSHAEETERLYADLLIGVTSFFRDAAAFEGLAEAIRRLLRDKGAEEPIRVWIVGCSTGQEAYSIAMLLLEAQEASGKTGRIQIFATDIDAEAIKVARAGLYSKAQVQSIGVDRLNRFFVETAEGYVVSKRLREICLFSVHSLIRDPPFARIDLLSCRNLLIYFDHALQDRVVLTIHHALRPNGILFVGRSESAARYGELFAPLDKNHRLFERRDLVRPHRTPFWAAPDGEEGPAVASPRVPPAPVREEIGELVAAAMDRHVPVHVVVTEEADLVYVSAGIERYFTLPAGPFGRQVLAMARTGLRRSLAAALNRVIKTGVRVARNVIVKTLDGPQRVRLTVEPLGSPSQQRYLVVLADLGTIEPVQATEVRAEEVLLDHHLEQDLIDTHKQIQGYILQSETAAEELRSANEEMLSTNEELQSSNEELETSKEELETVNEELSTVNQELLDKIENLDRVNSDLRNIFESTRLAIVFLDEKMRIRSFTPALTDIYALRPSDIGRSLADIAHNLKWGTLDADFAALGEASAPLEHALTSRDGHVHYLMRMLPYVNSNGVSDGALVIFVDVTAVVKAEEHERFQTLMIGELNHRVKNVLAVAISLAERTFDGDRQGRRLKAYVGRLHALVAAEMAPYQSTAASERITFGGPAVLMTPRTASTLSLVLHELATNAMKYGALSNEAGRLTIGWTLSKDRSDLDLRWAETGGPVVLPPTRHGFGTDLITQGVEYELDGKASVEYLPAGVRVRMVLPMEGQFLVPATS